MSNCKPPHFSTQILTLRALVSVEWIAAARRAFMEQKERARAARTIPAHARGRSLPQNRHKTTKHYPDAA